MTRAAVALAALLIILPTLQQPRDNRRLTGIGTSSIVGVISDDGERHPMRRARVTISSVELEFSRTLVTRDDGAFAFETLPAGRYSVRASKDGYVTTAFGASRPGRPGKTILLGAGARSRVDLRLFRGSVITGTVLNPGSEAAVGVTVTALTSTYQPGTGERRLVTAVNGSATTDDRGVYRIFGLAAGSYVVAALPRVPFAGMPGDIQMVSAAEIRSALAEVRQGLTAASPGIQAPAPPPPASQAVRRSVAFSPIFYPGTPQQTRAMTIDLGPAEEQREVNLDLQYVPTATIEGIVTVPPDMRAQVLITEIDRSVAGPTTRISAVPDADGRFMLRSIPPGTYTISARAFSSVARAGASPAGTLLYGETNVIVNGEDVNGVAVPLAPAATITGTLAFESTSGDVPQLGVLRFPLQAVTVGSSNTTMLPTGVIEGSRFSLAGVIPGVYRFLSAPRGMRAPIGRWWLRSLVLGGREMLDRELELQDSSDDGVITFSDRASEIAGAVRAVDGTPVADGFVVIFSPQKSAWFHGSRRVAGIRISDEGRYAVRNLPPGEYFVAVTTDLEMNEWFDPEILRTLASAAPVRISLADYESRTQDLTLAR
jgi:hypothetical protein